VLITALATAAGSQHQPRRPATSGAFDAEGNPTQAALGFAKKCGVELSEIDQSGPKLRYSQNIAGKPTASLLPTIVEDSLNDLPIPKRMRWGAQGKFVRPTQWLVMLLGDQVIDCTILAQKAGRDSRGHRFHHPESVRITTPPTTSKTCAPPMYWPTPTSVAS
jgi:glycyl-tRNA synthetase beta chain